MIIFKEVNWTNTDNALRTMDENTNKLVQMDKEAKTNGKLVGRYIEHPIADGLAYYLITKETKTKVHIESVGGLGDDWTIPAWGDKCTVPKKLVVAMLSARDKLATLFGG